MGEYRLFSFFDLIYRLPTKQFRIKLKNWVFKVGQYYLFEFGKSCNIHIMSRVHTCDEQINYF